MSAVATLVVGGLLTFGGIQGCSKIEKVKQEKFEAGKCYKGKSSRFAEFILANKPEDQPTISYDTHDNVVIIKIFTNIVLRDMYKEINCPKTFLFFRNDPKIYKNNLVQKVMKKQKISWKFYEH